MAFEEGLIQYGAIGICLLYFMYDKLKFQSAMTKVIENNTIACTKVYEVINHCKQNERKVKGG
jgi:hypothetical protein